ncbi:HlyD family efflux transporter periplasmic adaptor subunit [Paenibacillus sp. MZ04-78.2]|uniref:HlyD family secretion protein n=1 Tax=Paenibacillus sp. MZ04-78.2 TaxID=2962034 RepID=UPI0020B7C276|nr:HlyD family efflux transporter periplasmic adaptor subunit [Paenibacillus sp. MZ04-78.2]MCP3773907.1 HlyD family efflux transporter periplasmic adaptor subunit [Paenibacillus sp. MZ04-78.2]
MKKQVAAIVVLALALSGGGWMLAAQGKDAVTLASSNKGSILTAEQVNVSFQGVAGKIIELSIKEEQTVRKGDVLMSLDPTDIDLQLRKAQADVEVTTLKIKQAEDGIQVAKSKLDNAVRLAQVGLSQAETQVAQVADGARSEDIERQRLAVAASEESYTHALKLYNQLLNTEEAYDNNPYSYKDHRDAVEKARSQVATLENARNQQQTVLDKMLTGATDKERKLAALQADRAKAVVEQQQLAEGDISNQQIGIEALNKQLEQLNILMESLKVQKDRFTLRAPADGKVVRIIPKAGENVGSGMPVVVLETGKLYYDLYVDERQVGKFQAGSAVPTHFAALPDKVEGKVQFVTAAPQFAALRMSREKGTADLNSFQVRVYVERTDKLLPGMTAEVRVDEIPAR